MMVAGERSGDAYGAELASELKHRVPRLEIFGCGGDGMRSAGVETVADARQFSMVGITEVLSGLPRAYRAFRELLDEADRRRPQLAVLIDSPSLNLRLAKRLKPRGVGVCYFISPQVWAWKRWRMRHLRQRVDNMLCIFDFEEEIYRKAGVPVQYIGHPLVDMLEHRNGFAPRLSRMEFFAQAHLDPAIRTVALLPGSRGIEVALNLPAMLSAASLLGGRGDVQFLIAAAPGLDPAWVESKVRQGYQGGAALRVLSGMTQDALRHSDVGVVASGTATVEAALLERPMVVVYRVARSTAFFARLMIDVPYYSMVNLLARKQVVNELIQNDLTPERLAAETARLLDHPEAREAQVREFRLIRQRLGGGGAIARAAHSVLNMMEERSPS